MTQNFTEIISVLFLCISVALLKFRSSKIPAQRMTNIPREISEVDFDFQVLINCGRKASVVNVPAVKPKIVTKFIPKSPFTILF